jgi:hypothetical protein
MECVDRVDSETGFWATRSAAGEPEAPLGRLYWSSRPESIGAVLSRVTALLERLGLRYSLKSPVRPADLGRVDPLVVYLERGAWEGARRAFVEAAEAMRPLLRSSVPPLTLALAPGLGFAEDPTTRESFGQSRCRALAAGVIALAAEASPSTERSLALLTDALVDAHIDPEHPWICQR